MSTLYVLVPVTHQHPNVDWSRERERYRALVLARLAKIGIKDLENRIRFEHMITPADWDRGYEIHRGATFNLAHNLSQMLHLRPRNRFEDLESVYLVGGGTHPGSGLPVIFESARITSRLLVEDLGIPCRSWNPLPRQFEVSALEASAVSAGNTGDRTHRDRLSGTVAMQNNRATRSASSAVGWEDWRPRARSLLEGITWSCSSEIAG